MILNRRSFLSASLAFGASRRAWAATFTETVGVKIERIDLYLLRLPMNGYFKFFADAAGAGHRSTIVLKITADNGEYGWGESVPIARWSDETPETAMVALRDYFGPCLLGRTATDLDGAHAAMDAAIAPGFSTGMPITRAGVDLALHDLTGRLRGQSLPQLWDRDPGKAITLSWTVNASSLDQAEKAIEEGRKRGFSNFNIKVGAGAEFDVSLAKLVRESAPSGFLWADANGGYSPDLALRLSPRLADAGVDVLEAPLRPNQIRGYQALKRQRALPILMDEGVVSPVDLAEFYELGMLDGVAAKPSRCGGLMSCRAQIEFCQARGLTWLGSGLTDPDISLAASLSLYAAYGLTKPAALNGPQFLSGGVLSQALRIEGDQAFPPEGPGLAVDVDEDRVRSLAVSSASLR